MPNASTTQASSASETTGTPIPLSYGYVWATGKRHAYYMLQDTGNSALDYTRVGFWLLGHGEWDGCSELWINNKLVWRGAYNYNNTWQGWDWIQALDDPTRDFVFHFHAGTDGTIGAGLNPSSVGPDQGVDKLWSVFPPAIQPLAFSRIAYFGLMRKQAVLWQTNDHQSDPSQWTDINPVGLWRGLKVRTFDASGAMTGYSFSTNPAWHYVDVLLRRKIFSEFNIGAVSGIDDLTDAVRAKFNWTSIYNSAMYFDEPLANGRRRSQGSYSFTSRTSLQAVLTKILRVCRSYGGEYAGEVYLNCDQPRASVLTITRDMVMPGSFESDDADVHTAANKYVAKFRDLLVPQAAEILSITNTNGNGKPEVTTKNPHPFVAGDYVAMGGTGTAYDSEWKVDSVPDVVNPGTPNQVDPTTLMLVSKGTNYPSAVGAGGGIGLLYSRFKERSPEFWHKTNMMARGAVGVGIPRQRNKVRTELDLDISTYDQASRIARYERDRALGLDESPYVTPRSVRLKVPFYTRDDAGNFAAAVQCGDRITVDASVNPEYAGDYEVLDGLKKRPPVVRSSSDGLSLQGTPAADSGEIEFNLGDYDESILYDDSDSLQAGWPSVPGSDPGNDVARATGALEGGGIFAFFTGQLASGSQFQLPSTGFPSANVMSWASPAGANVEYHSMRVISICDADANRSLTLTYSDNQGYNWSGDVAYAALTWLSSDVKQTLGKLTYLELTLLGGETVMFAQGDFADGESFALPAGYSSAQMFAVAAMHDCSSSTTHNPRICGAYVDPATLTVYYKYTDYAGNYWTGTARVLIFAWKNNGGTVATETLGATKWCKITLSDGTKFGVGFASALADGAAVTLPSGVQNSDLQSVVTSSRWDDNGASYHTRGVLESYLGADNSVNIKFGSPGDLHPGWGDAFMLYLITGGAIPTLVTLNPISATIAPNASQQFAATVQNNANQNVTWSVDGIVGGNLTVGTISASGLYSAPATPGSHTVVATSVADPTASATATVNISGTLALGSVLTDDHGNIIYTDDGQTITV